MKKVFIPHTMPVKELLSVIRTIEAAGYDKNQAFVGNDFKEFAAPLQKGDTAVVYSLTAFHSITQILATSEELAARGVEFHSVNETWFNEPQIETKTLLANLFQLAEKLHKPLPVKIRTSKKRNSMLQIDDRVALAYELRASKNLSIAAACRTAGCSVSAYYAHNKKK